ncbi:MAG: hypothetical protein HY438_02770 [DPANN group archaeon]|nr:hypothetical protein [DPANN group archaeon]
MATLLRSKKAGIVGVIIDVVVASIFILMAATFISDILGSFVNCTGQIEDASRVACLGNGDGKVVCVDKDSGTEKFSCEAGSKWQVKTAASLPKLEWLAPAQAGSLAASNIFFGLGDHFCAYDWKGENLWGFNGCADLSDVAIPTGSDANSDTVCFGNGGSHTFYCLDKKTSEVKLKVHSNPDWGSTINAMSTPVLSKEGNTNYAYFGLGNRVCKYDVAKGDVKDAPNQAAWCFITDHTIPTVVVHGTDFDWYCFGGGADHTVHCLSSSGQSVFSLHGSWSDCPDLLTYHTNGEGLGDDSLDINRECRATATPLLKGNYIYAAVGNRLCKYDITNSGSTHENGDRAIWCYTYETQQYTLGIAASAVGGTIYKNGVGVASGSGRSNTQFAVGEIKGVYSFGNYVCAETDAMVGCFDDAGNFVFSAKILNSRYDADNTNKWLQKAFGGGSKSGTSGDVDVKFSCARESCKSMGQPVLSGGNLYFALGDLLCSYPTSVFAAGKQVEISNEDDKSDGRNWCVDVSDKQIQTGVAALPELEIIEKGPAYALAGANGKADLFIYATTNMPASCRYDDAAFTYDNMPDTTTKAANAVHTWELPNTAIGEYLYNVACKSGKIPGEADDSINVSVQQQDLSIKSFTIAPASGFKGGPAPTITTVISFNGPNAVGPYDIRLTYRSPSGTTGTVGTATVSSQSPGQDATKSFVFISPTETGSYSFTIAIDTTDVVKNEASEANNQQTINWQVNPLLCADGETDLSLSNPMVEYKDGSPMNLGNFDPNKRFMAHIDLKTTNHNCINDAKVNLYAKAPWMPAEMNLGAQGVQWDGVSPDATLNYPSDFGFAPPNDWAIFPRNPNTGQYDKGTYTLRFALTPIDAADPPAGNSYTITFTVV